MVLDDFDIERLIVAFRPLEAYPPLLIDSDTELPFSVSAQCLKMIAWQPHQIVVTHRCLEEIEPSFCLISEGFELFHSFASSKTSGASIAISRRSLNRTELVHI
jgi:hypothetical protein